MIGVTQHRLSPTMFQVVPPLARHQGRSACINGPTEVGESLPKLSFTHLAMRYPNDMILPFCATSRGEPRSVTQAETVGLEPTRLLHPPVFKTGSSSIRIISVKLPHQELNLKSPDSESGALPVMLQGKIVYLLSDAKERIGLSSADSKSAVVPIDHSA